MVAPDRVCHHVPCIKHLIAYPIKLIIWIEKWQLHSKFFPYSFLGAQVDFTTTQRTPITAVFTRYIEINCSAKNFCDIMWLKDGSSLYPFGFDSFIELRYDNQVLELQKAYYDRAGNYTCLARDGTMTISRTVEIMITGLF